MPAAAQVVLSTLDTPVTQNFDTLPASGSATWTNNSTLPGWYAQRTASGTLAFNVDNGSSNSGSLHDYGATGATERALGAIKSGSSGAIYFGVLLTNNTGSTITSLDVSYDGEQWRDGNAAATTLAFSYVTGSGFTGALADFTSAGTNVAALNFVAPVHTAAAAAIDGNTTGKVANLSSTLTGLNIPVGSQVFLRWADAGPASGSDNGLGIDNFSVTPHGATAAAPALSIDDVTQNEGDAGTTAFTFTVSLSPASTNAVSFDIATQNNTAFAPADYSAASTTLTIPAGQTSTTFTVLVNGDTTVELNETFFVTLSNATGGATIADAQGVGTIVNDDVAPPTITPIHDVQGSVVGTTPGTISGCGSGNDASPLCGQSVTIEAVVTATFPALSAGQLGGFNVQEETVDEDGDANTSEGVFVYCPSCTGIKEGDRVRVTGAVVEYFGLTEISALPAGVVVTEGTANHLSEVTPAHIILPIPVGVDINAYYEAREGMLVQFDELTVSEYFQLFRYGQVVLVAGDRPRTFTEDNAPSVSGLAAHLDEVARRQVILDDDRDGDEAALNQTSGQQSVYWPHGNGGFSLGMQGQDFFRGGDKVQNLIGVLQWSRPSGLQSPATTWRVRPSNSYPVAFTPVNLRPQTPPDVGGSIRVVGMNLLNYFTTIDTTSSSSSGSCGTSHTLDCRGADSQAELDRQTARAAKVICDLSPDVASFMELENNDVPTATTTIDTLLTAVNAKCGGAHPYTYQNNATGTLGTDAIRVMIVYRGGIVAPFGAAQVDTNSIHSRPPMAQTFDVVDASNPAFGKRFTVVANHLKSKGSCPTSGVDADQNDGQSCWADKRRLQAERTATWITSTVIPAAGSTNVLLLGDFNSYASEDSVQSLKSAGYHDLETELHGTNAYSYLFGGEIGHLDYAFANNALRSQVAGADAWHINADEVDLFDYNDDVKDTGEAAYEEKPNGGSLTPARSLWDANLAIRASDHDPVVVGLFPVVPEGHLTIAPTTLTFGDQGVGTTSTAQSVTLANTGDAALDVTISAAAAPFARTADGSCDTNATITIAVGVSCTLTYTFAPTVAGSATQTLTLTANGPGSGTVALSGNGTQGHLSITPSTVDFGNQAVFSASSPQTVTLKNDGTASLSVTTLDAATSPFVRAAASTCATTLPITLAANSSCTLVYTFMPTVTGTATQTLAVTANAPGSGSITLSGNGVQGHLAITPASVDFGNQTTGTTSAGRIITIKNDGTAPLDILALTAVAPPFARVAGGCAATPFTLAANVSCELTYTFTPTTTGVVSQNLTVTANAPGNGTIALSGNGAAPPTADVAVTIVHDRDYAQYGDTLNYVITVKNPDGPAAATVDVLDALPGGLVDGAWTCTPTGAATCASGSGDVLGDTATLPIGTQVSYTYSATVQSGAPDLLANHVTAAVTNVSDPNTANNSADDSVTVVIFRDGFDAGAATLALAPYADGRGFASVALRVDRNLLDAAGIMPVAIASGRTDDRRNAFTLELARFGANHFLRLTTVDAEGRIARGQWQAASFEQPLDFAWQSATSARDDGYLRVVAGAAALQSTGSDGHRLVELRIPNGPDATPWLSVQAQ